MLLQEKPKRDNISLHMKNSDLDQYRSNEKKYFRMEAFFSLNCFRNEIMQS